MEQDKNKEKIKKLQEKINRCYQAIAILQEQMIFNISNFDNENDIIIMAMKEEYNKIFKTNLTLREFTKEKAIELNNYFQEQEYKRIEKYTREIRKLKTYETIKVEYDKDILTGVYTLVKKEYIS